MGGSRANGGNQFERDIIDENGWTNSPTKLRFLNAKEEGVSDVKAIYFKYKDDITKIPLCSNAVLTKRDAIREDGTPVEIKKTTPKGLLSKGGMLYGEPFSKIAHQGRSLSKHFDDGYDTWNRLTKQLFNHIISDSDWQNTLALMNNIVADIVIEDGAVIPSNHIELFWSMKGSTHYRIQLQMRIKEIYRSEYV